MRLAIFVLVLGLLLSGGPAAILMAATDTPTPTPTVTPVPPSNACSTGNITAQNSVSSSAPSAVDSVLSTYWQSYSANTTNTTVWLQCDQTGIVYAYAFQMTSSSVSTNNFPHSWTLYGSNDGTNWTGLDSRTVSAWSLSEYRSYEVSSFAEYSHFRWVMSNFSTNGNLIMLGEVELYLLSVIPTATPGPTSAATDTPEPTITLTPDYFTVATMTDGRQVDIGMKTSVGEWAIVGTLALILVALVFFLILQATRPVTT